MTLAHYTHNDNDDTPVRAISKVRSAELAAEVRECFDAARLETERMAKLWDASPPLESIAAPRIAENDTKSRVWPWVIAGLVAVAVLAWALADTIEFIRGYWEIYETSYAVGRVLAIGYVGVVVGMVIGVCWCGRARR